MGLHFWLTTLLFFTTTARLNNTATGPATNTNFDRKMHFGCQTLGCAAPGLPATATVDWCTGMQVDEF